MIRRTPGKSAVWKDGKLTIFPLSKVIEPGFHGDKPSNCQPRTYPFGKGIGTSGDFPEKKAYEAYRREKPLLLKEWQITDIELANSKLRREKNQKKPPKKEPTANGNERNGRNGSLKPFETPAQIPDIHRGDTFELNIGGKKATAKVEMWGGAIGEERAVGKISISTPNPFEWVELVLYTAEIPKKGFNGAIFGVPNQQHIEANFGSREAVVEAVWKAISRK